MGLYQKFCEWGTDAKFVPHGKKCDICGKKLSYLDTGFWSINANGLPTVCSVRAAIKS